MWAAKLPGEGAALADACEAMVAVMAALGVAVDGGKDSLSMAARVGTETVRAPGEVWGPQGGEEELQGWAGNSFLWTPPCSTGSLVISAYAVCPDITATVTPDLKHPEGRGMVVAHPIALCVLCLAPALSAGPPSQHWAVVFSGTDCLGVSPHAGNSSAVSTSGTGPPPQGRILLPSPLPVSPGHLLYVPLSPGQHRLGGTALAQCFSQLGEHPPDLDVPENLVRAFSITQGLLKGK